MLQHQTSKITTNKLHVYIVVVSQLITRESHCNTQDYIICNTQVCNTPPFERLSFDREGSKGETLFLVTKQVFQNNFCFSYGRCDRYCFFYHLSLWEHLESIFFRNVCCSKLASLTNNFFRPVR